MLVHAAGAKERCDLRPVVVIVLNAPEKNTPLLKLGPQRRSSLDGWWMEWGGLVYDCLYTLRLLGLAENAMATSLEGFSGF